MLWEGELWGFAVLPDENTLDRSVAPSEYSIELRAYDDEPLVSDIAEGTADGVPDDTACPGPPAGYSLGSYWRVFIAADSLPGPHCCNCVVRFPVLAIVTPDAPGGGRGPDGCELPFEEVAGSKEGYW